MGRTYSQILSHVVFSTKNRRRHLTHDVIERLFAYMGGIIRDEGGTLLAAGGVEDHVHVLIQLRTDMALANLMRSVKAKSSRWIKDEFPNQAEFAWQEGYAAFSVSKSQQATVIDYIARQREHHHGNDFKTEFLKLLEAHGVEYDDRFVFE